MTQNKSYLSLLPCSLFPPVRSGLAATVLVLLGLSQGLMADDARPRFVSGNGSDQGDCQNVFRPCRTPAYAIEQAGKGDLIKVSAGDYPVSNADELHTLIGALGRLQGGMDPLSDFKVQDTANHTSTLIGIPAEYRSLFNQAGFRVIADTKGIDSEEKANMRALSKQLFSVRKSHARTDCVDGSAGQFSCQNINLHSHLSFADLDGVSAHAMDIWGFVDLNTHREYAIIGLSHGAAFVDVTTPAEPFVVGVHEGLSSGWRDIKVHQMYDASAERWRAYAYISTEASMDLAVFDLSQLPNSIERVPHVSDHKSAHNVYIANVDFTFGAALAGREPVLTVAGAALGLGKYRLYSLANPGAPQLIYARPGNSTNQFYMHDAASISIADSRKDSQCQDAAARASCDLLADFNENSVEIWEISDADNPKQLSSFTYNNATYVHSGWWTEDGRYLLVHDELDETKKGINTTVRVYDMTDLENPEPAGSWVGPNRAIDHNGFVRGNRYYISNYAEGLTVLDISNPASPARVAWFDTVPTSSETDFVGAWGVYPFLPSGTVIVSDMNSGLYVLEDKSRQRTNGSFILSSATYSGVEGEPITIQVDRIDGSAEAVSVSLELLYLTANDEDIDLDTTVLNWDDGDTGSKTASLQLANDAVVENIERLAVRLVSPTGGATLQYPNLAYIYLSDPSTATELNLLSTSSEVAEKTGSAFITVNRSGSVEGAVSVSYRTLAENESEVFEATSGTLNWADGEAQAKTVAIPLLRDSDFDGDQTMQVEIHSAVGATLGENNTVTFVVKDEETNSQPPPGNNDRDDVTGGSGGGNSGRWGLLFLVCLMLYRLRSSRWLRSNI